LRSLQNAPMVTGLLLGSRFDPNVDRMMS